MQYRGVYLIRQRSSMLRIDDSRAAVQNMVLRSGLAATSISEAEIVVDAKGIHHTKRETAKETSFGARARLKD